jgi:hypothetical protein
MRCEFEKDPTDNTCKRCKSNGVACIVEGRKPRTAPNKREYLLAQIRQKDAIIESLLRQIHNPYTATPMSIASYRMAISPSDENNKDIISWLDLLQTSLKTGTSNVSPPIVSPSGGGSGAAGGGTFNQHRGADVSVDDDSDTESPQNENNRTHKQLVSFYGLQVDEDAALNSSSGPMVVGDSLGTSASSSSLRSSGGLPSSGDGSEEEDSKIKIQQNLPDEVVPLGLIANLALDDAKSDKTLTRKNTGMSHTSSQNMSTSDSGVTVGTPGSAAGGTPGGRGAQSGVRPPGASAEDLDEEEVGVASKTYFLPGPATDLSIRAMMIEQHSPPEILVHGLVSPTDVNKLFEIFYEKLNPFISLLDPVLHTPASTFTRCPFLFTVICAVSSRYYADKSEIYPIAMHFAKHAAANALIDGWKSVELCQAYIIMSIWGVPAKRWEEDRSWLYTGLAIRIATDLNLHQLSGNVDPGSTSAAGPRMRGSSAAEQGGASGSQRTGPDGKVIISASERQEREILNRTRVWMICFNLDRSTATQFGKPITVKEDFAMRNQADWHTRSKYNHPFDVHLCAYTALVRIVARFHDEVFSDVNTPTGLNQQLNFKDVTQRHNKALSEYHATWQETFNQWSDNDDPGSAFRCKLLPFLVAYSRLVMWSFGFQKAFKSGMKAEDLIFLEESMNAAKTILKVMIESLAPSGYMKNSPDGHFVFCSFASAFLLKLLRPECSKFLSKEQETEIFDLIGRLIQILSGPEIAIDDRHTPKLYARFLAGLLSKYRRDGATVGRLHPQPPSNSPGGANSEYPSYGGPSSGPSSSTFPAQGPSSGGGGHTGMEGHYHSFSLNMAGVDRSQLQQDPLQQKTMSTPIYRAEAAYGVDSSGGSLAISWGDPMDTMNYDNPDFADEELLATMKALKNPEWWDNMMMPGFTWPQMTSPVQGSFSDYSTSDSSPLSPMGYHHAELVPLV